MNEYPGEVNFFLQRFQKRPYEYLDSFHVLSDRFIGAHSIMVSAHERALLRERDVKVCHCPFSNCGKGVPETPALLEDGICVGLGTDGAAHGGLSLWNEMKIFRSVMNVKHGVAQSDPAIMPAAQIISMVTKEGYHLMKEDGGVIAEGKKAAKDGMITEKPFYIYSDNTHKHFSSGMNAVYERFSCGSSRLVNNND